MVSIAGGLASFRGGEPSVDELNEWTKEALEAPLVEYLQEETDLNYITSSRFTSLTPAPTAAPTEAPLVVVGSTSGETQSVESAGLIAGGITAGFAILAFCAVVLSIVGRRRQQLEREKPKMMKQVSTVPPPLDDDDVASSDEEGGEEDSSLQTNQNRRSSFDVESVATSDWTLSSNLTDAFTIKNGQMFPRSSHSLMQTESFERDRQVSLKKT